MLRLLLVFLLLRLIGHKRCSGRQKGFLPHDGSRVDLYKDISGTQKFFCMMEQQSAAQVSSLYGVSMGEYGGGDGVSSMMALMTQQEGGQTQGNGVPSSYPLFHGLMSGASTAIFNAEKLQQLASVSSSPFVKTEGCPNLADRFEFRREQAGNSFTEAPCMQLVNPAVTSLASPSREEAHSLGFSINSRTPTAAADEEEAAADAMKAKILAHPWYPCLMEAYIDCQKVGAPEEVVARLDAVREEYKNRRHRTNISVGMDPELDRFMEAYREMLSKYQEELTKPLKEAIAFFSNIETQLSSLCKEAIRISPPADDDDKTKGGGSSDEEGCSTGEMDDQDDDHHSEDKELKDHLLRKYKGYLSGLKQEFMKRKKKGKLPKDARQKLLDWWTLHYKWPYPAESEKAMLAESTGLDQKQINNWFINQRKRHWKPSEDMQFVVMDTNSPHGAALYMERRLMNEGSAFHLDC